MAFGAELGQGGILVIELGNNCWHEFVHNKPFLYFDVKEIGLQSLLAQEFDPIGHTLDVFQATGRIPNQIKSDQS